MSLLMFSHFVYVQIKFYNGQATLSSKFCKKNHSTIGWQRLLRMSKTQRADRETHSRIIKLVKKGMVMLNISLEIVSKPLATLTEINPYLNNSILLLLIDSSFYSSLGRKNSQVRSMAY